MKTFVSLVSFVLLSLPAVAVPALADKPPKWEYAELTCRTSPGRPARVDPDGGPIDALPATVTVRWITRDGETETKGWADLAEKLKTTGFKNDGTAAFQKVQILNILGGEGWEIMEHQGTAPFQSFGPGGDRPTGKAGPTATTTWLFKRRVP